VPVRTVTATTPSFHDDTVGPFHKAHKNGGAAEFCAPLGYIRLRDPTGTGTGPSSKDGNVLGDDFSEGFCKRRPAYRDNGAGRGFAHQIGGFAKKKNLDVMTGIG